MSQLESIEDVAIALDISSRTAMYALAKACSTEEINHFYAMLSDILIIEYGPAKVPALVELHKKAALVISKAGS